MPPTNATSRSGRPGWRSTTSFWWCDPPGANPHVPQALAAGGFDVLTEMPVLLLAEREPVEVRAPHQSLDHHATAGGVRENSRDLSVRVAQALVGITPPIGEQQQVTGSHGLHLSLI